MTEALKQWSWDRGNEENEDKLEGAHPLSAATAEFWLRAFCSEVEKRASLKYPSGLYDGALGKSMNELKRELLGP